MDPRYELALRVGLGAGTFGLGGWLVGVLLGRVLPHIVAPLAVMACSGVAAGYGAVWAHDQFWGE